MAPLFMRYDMDINSSFENRLLIAGIQPNPLSNKNRNIILSFYKGLGDEVLLTGIIKEIKTRSKRLRSSENLKRIWYHQDTGEGLL